MEMTCLAEAGTALFQQRGWAAVPQFHIPSKGSSLLAGCFSGVFRGKLILQQSFPGSLWETNPTLSNTDQPGVRGTSWDTALGKGRITLPCHHLSQKEFC